MLIKLYGSFTVVSPLIECRPILKQEVSASCTTVALIQIIGGLANSFCKVDDISTSELKRP